MKWLAARLALLRSKLAAAETSANYADEMKL